MKQKNTIKSKPFIIFLLVIAMLAGALLAKVVPMKAGNGFSSLFEKKIVAEKQETNTTETTAVTDTKESEVKKMTYTEQVNEEITNGQFSGRLSIPLLIQTDEPWKNTEYGSENPAGNTIGINGCAIVSLAMVSSFLDQKEYTIQDILNWSKNDYYLEGQGTAWSIFYEFAVEKGYQYEDLGMDMAAVEEQLKQNHPVIISVKPGYFTETGHIMVLTGTNNGKFWLNDPNDSEEKGHSKKEFTEEELTNEALNFWSLYKA